jgi:hypothetical protein
LSHLRDTRLLRISSLGLAALRCALVFSSWACIFPQHAGGKRYGTRRNLLPSRTCTLFERPCKHKHRHVQGEACADDAIPGRSRGELCGSRTPRGAADWRAAHASDAMGKGRRAAETRHGIALKVQMLATALCAPAMSGSISGQCRGCRRVCAATRTRRFRRRFESKQWRQRSNSCMSEAVFQVFIGPIALGVLVARGCIPRAPRVRNWVSAQLESLHECQGEQCTVPPCNYAPPESSRPAACGAMAPMLHHSDSSTPSCCAHCNS